MDFATYSVRLEYLLDMAIQDRLLSINQVSEKFNCSERTINRMLNALRDKGFDIEYCKRQKRFLYNK
ncbi:MAG: HTH domain-containing protein [Bacteroidetes bacterium]|nr:HTH domain-containing protein [Bacteroidota bacterium]